MHKIVAILALLVAVHGSPAKAQFRGLQLPGFAGAALNAVAEQLQLRAISAILASISNSAFEEGKLVLAKQQWACQKLAQAEEILEELSQETIGGKVAEIKAKLFCDITDAIPADLTTSPDESNSNEGME
ncbi:MAG: hypothetical protein ACK5GZ_11575 [Cyanobium sp.]|jgi:hypothetical protein